MMRIKRGTFILTVGALLFLTTCTKDPGPGGNSVIKGKIKIVEYNEDFSEVRGTYYAQDEDVFVIFGDEDIYGDDFKTSPDGSFSFEFLRPGKYTLYVYSEDSSGTSVTGEIPVYQEVEISENKEVVDVGEIVILKTSKINSGTSSISGRVFAKEYSPDFSLLIGQYYIFDEDVFIVEGNHQYYSDDLKTDVDGWYKFDRLPIGHYKVYAVSRDSTGTVPSGHYAVMQEVDITSAHQQVVLNDIVIFK